MAAKTDSNMTRRSFVSATTGLATAVLWPSCLRAKESPREELTFVVVSDTHLGYRDKPSAAQQWKKTATEIAKGPGELVLHLGDVVDGGREAQYPIYLEARKQIQRPIYEIPGNHDPQELFKKHIRKKVDMTVDCKWLRFLLLGNAHTDSHDGFLTDAQIGWIDEECQAARKADRFVAICMHVTAHKNRHPDRGWYVKPADGQTKLYAVLKRHEDRVLALMHGHFHNGIRGWDDNGPIHEIIFPSALYNRDRRLVEQKAPGYNVKEFRPGYTLVTIKDGAMEMRYRPVGADSRAKKRCKLPQLAGS